jgi:hypothetical protein
MKIMKKFRVICILYFLASGALFCQDQAKNIFGLSAGIAPGVMDMYFDMPFNFWPNRELSPIYNVFYARQVTESFRIGGYAEYEKAKFSDNTSEDIYSFNRYNMGLYWLGQFPKTALHLQLGGYFGYGFLRADNWDNLKGADYGFIAGPAYERGKLGIAVHVHQGHAWYESTGTPIGVMLYTPKYMLKIYYKL